MGKIIHLLFFCIAGCASVQVPSSRVDKRPVLPPGQVRVAMCQFPVSADIQVNAEWIRKQMRSARQQGADVAHFPEVALGGYNEMKTDADWAQQHREMDTILELARELHIWALVGSLHRLSDPALPPHTSTYVISPAGRVVERYDKHFEPIQDLDIITCGDHFSVFEINGVKCGLLICYDNRFPELYRQYWKRGVRLLFHSFLNAGNKNPNWSLLTIQPATAQANAAQNFMFVSAVNGCRPYSWTSRMINPEGIVEAQAPLNQPAVVVYLVDIRRKFYDACGDVFRDYVINGRLNGVGGQGVDDPRSLDRTCY